MRFNAGDAVLYFYEPFLEAFDSALRKQLGVWYTPAEVVRYMVARVDKAMKADLGIADGLAADNVYVLDPCCGTGAYPAEVLRRIAANLQGKGLGVLAGAAVKQAATERVFGFGIMPAPFVVAHLQVGLTLQSLDAPLMYAPIPAPCFASSLWERAGACPGFDPGERVPRRTPQYLPDQRLDRLGTAYHQTVALPRTGRRTRDLRRGDACVAPTQPRHVRSVPEQPRAYWCNVPAAVWRYKLGGYQVLKKWLSYRERNILARPQPPAEFNRGR